MVSRLQSALEARIAKCRDPVQAACLRAEKAALLARQGHLDAARTELVGIHARFDSRPTASVSAWVSLAEGLMAFHGDLDTSARDKLLRAFALSSAVKDQGLRVLSSAWLAHMCYLEMDFEAMARHLTLALTEAAPGADAARARACLVAAQAYHWADRFDLAQPWYAQARQHATHEGDETLLSALMLNMSWLRAAQARRMAVSGSADPAQVRQVLLGAESSDHFDQRIGIGSLHSLAPMLRALVLTLLERYAEALVLFTAHLDAALLEGLGQRQCGTLAEVAWCRVNLGDADGARSAALQAQRHIAESSEFDERAATHGRLSQIFTALNEPDLALPHRAEAESDWARHGERQARLLELLSTSAGLGTAPPTIQAL